MNMLHRLCALVALFALFFHALRPSVFGQGNGQDTILIGQPIAGIDVDATGVLRVKQFDPRLAQQRLAAARAHGDANVMRPSELRKISLNRLEAAISEQLAAGQGISDEMKALAGLTSVQYVFFYPETNDIVIAGPAEGFFADPTERSDRNEHGSPDGAARRLGDRTACLRPQSKTDHGDQRLH